MTHKLLRFGAFELNLSTEELRKHGTIMRLSPQPFHLLALLASHSGQIVSREEIHKRLWDDETFVDFEQGVNKCIKQVRTVLNDNADRPVYIETIPRQGYRFLAEVVSKTVEPPAPLVTASTSGIQSRTAVAARLQPSAAQQSAAASVQTVAVVDAAPLTSPEDVDIHKRPSAFRSWWAFPVVAVLVVGLIAGGFYWRARNASVLTEKDTIVLADFVNTTGDSVFDDTLKQGLSVNLEQSPFLDLVSERRVMGTLSLMGRPPSERLTPEDAREVCQRTGSKAMVAGSIAGLGNQYVIGLKVVDCNTGDLLAETQKQAAGKESVLKALDAAATSLRSRLGESLTSVQKYTTPLEEASTTSLEALKPIAGAKNAFRKRRDGRIAVLQPSSGT